MRAVNNFWSRSPLHTHGFASWMRGIWFDREQLVAVNRIQCPATGAAESAIAMDHGCHKAYPPDDSLLGLPEEESMRIGKSSAHPNDRYRDTCRLQRALQRAPELFIVSDDRDHFALLSLPIQMQG
jgi:hypothetical protein